VSSEGFNYVPLAVMAQASVTHTQNNNTTDPDTGETVSVNQRNNDLVFSGGSVFFATKFSDYVGAFIQWSYDNLATTADGTLGGHSGIDNTDIRVAGKYSRTGAAEPDLVYGMTLNNNPTAQDPWNSTPAFGFPYTSSPRANAGGGNPDRWHACAASLGVGGYLWWQKMIYGELSFYRTANGGLRPARRSDIHTDGGVAAIQNWNNPYWRFALSHDWGANSVMIGTYGMIVNRYPSNFDTSTATDRYRDIAVDAQYQYITDPHTFTAQATYISEKQSYNASYEAVVDTGEGIGAGPTPENPTDTLKTFKIKGTYYYDRKYGGTLVLRRPGVPTREFIEPIFATPEHPTAVATSLNSTIGRSRTSG
jgi:hypothetical protein